MRQACFVMGSKFNILRIGNKFAIGSARQVWQFLCVPAVLRRTVAWLARKLPDDYIRLSESMTFS
jgi:hypothetical protein